MRWNDLPRHSSLQEHGFTPDEIDRWRAFERSAGRPSGVEDFYREHGLCLECECTGARIAGWDPGANELLWEICPTCEGTGQAP